MHAEGTEFEAMMNADETFRQQASEATRRSPDWSYAKESSLLKAALLEAAKRGKKVQELKASAGKSNQNTVQFIQQLQQQIQAIQASQVSALLSRPAPLPLMQSTGSDTLARQSGIPHP